ncbi:AbrB family transcriptional regulator [Aphanothece microscopica]
MDGLGQIFGVSGDPKGDRLGSHGGEHCGSDENTQSPNSQGQTGPMSHALNLAIYACAGLAGGLLALRTGIPAAPLAGALLAAALVSLGGHLETAAWPPGTRTALEIGIGTVIGAGLSGNVLQQLHELWRPALVITISLVLAGLGVGLICSRLLGVDPTVALLGAAPGGISGMSLVGAEFGVGAAVAALHAVRLITVLIVLPVVVKAVLPEGEPPP